MAKHSFPSLELAVESKHTSAHLFVSLRPKGPISEAETLMTKPAVLLRGDCGAQCPDLDRPRSTVGCFYLEVQVLSQKRQLFHLIV